jgi:hypothetical protein
MTFIFDQAGQTTKRRQKRRKTTDQKSESSLSFLAFLQRERDLIENNECLRQQKKKELELLNVEFQKIKTSCPGKFNQIKIFKINILKKKKELNSIKIMSMNDFDKKIIPLLDMYYSKKMNSEFTDEYIIELYKQAFNRNSTPPLIHDMNADICQECNVKYVLSKEESSMYCEECGHTVHYINANSSSVAYGDEIEYTAFSYKRINHLNEWLNHFQAKESTPVPQSVMLKIMNYLYENRCVDIQKITFAKVKKAQKALGLRKYYDQTMQIWCRLTGKKPIRLDPVCEEKIKLMFIRIQVPFDKHCPKKRKNFLSYPFCMYKFCQLLNYTELLPYFSLLKGKDKLQLQENIFAKICKDIGWDFIPINST